MKILRKDSHNSHHNNNHHKIIRKIYKTFSKLNMKKKKPCYKVKHNSIKYSLLLQEITDLKHLKHHNLK